MASKPHYDADTNDITYPPTGGDGTYLLGPRAFNIVWGNDPRYWRISTQSGNATELVQVSWLEVTGSVTVEKGKKYQISFQLSMKSDAFGWNNSPVFLMAKVGKRGKYTWKRLTLQEQCTSNITAIPDPSGPNRFQIEVPVDLIDTRLYFGLYEVWSGKWKGGLRIHGATVKEVRQDQMQTPA